MGKMLPYQAPAREDGLANVGEAMEFLRVSRSSLYSLMDRGVLPYVKLGASRRVEWKELHLLVHRSRVGRET
jgi:excisionase family DNA binding protein